MSEEIKNNIEEKIEERALIDPYRTNEDPARNEAELERIEANGVQMMKMLDILKKKGKNHFFYSEAGMRSKELTSRCISALKTGLHATYPIACKGDACPYGRSCFALKNGIQPPYGEPCVLEADRIERLVTGYNDDFDFKECTLTDTLAINELIQLDILIARCQKLMAEEELPVTEIAIGETKHGDAITQPVTSRYYEAYERMSKRRSALVDELNASRKARKNLGVPEKKESWETVLEMAGQQGFLDEDQKPDKFK